VPYDDASRVSSDRGRPCAQGSRRTRRRWPSALLAPALCLLVGAPAAHAGLVSDPASPANALWNIIASCVDAPHDAAASYCACPAFTRSCCGDPKTPNADVVWGETQDFVVIRDLSMCGCEAGFVAGLAIPRSRITGIEDPARPDGIWPFAWDVARRHIADETEIGLVINPDDARTQNQMHVHLLRLDRGARALLDSLEPTSDGTWLRAPAALVLPLPDLDHVFATAADRVGADAIGTHGILVARAKRAGYLAVLTDRSSPQVLTRSHCR